MGQEFVTESVGNVAGNKAAGGCWNAKGVGSFVVSLGSLLRRNK